MKRITTAVLVSSFFLTSTFVHLPAFAVAPPSPSPAPDGGREGHGGDPFYTNQFKQDNKRKEEEKKKIQQKREKNTAQIIAYNKKRLLAIGKRVDKFVEKGLITAEQKRALEGLENEVEALLNKGSKDKIINREERIKIAKARRAYSRAVTRAIMEGKNAKIEDLNGELENQKKDIEDLMKEIAEANAAKVKTDAEIDALKDKLRESGRALANLKDDAEDALDSVKEFSWRAGMAHGRYLNGLLLGKIGARESAYINQKIASISRMIGDAYEDIEISEEEEDEIIAALEGLENLISNVWGGKCTINQGTNQVTCTEGTTSTVTTTATATTTETQTYTEIEIDPDPVEYNR